MKLIAATLLATTACLSLSGCPSQTLKDGAKAAEKTPDVGAAPQDINATAAQCRTERDVLQTAVDSYTILNDGPPASEAAMVPDWLRVESLFMDLDAAGNVVPAPGSGCL